MPAALQTIVDRLRATISQFSAAQKTLSIIGITGLILGGLALYSWVSKPTMSPLFANLSATDASAIVDQLNSSGVQYELTDGGATILVPNKDLYPTRMSVAAAGLPADAEGDGYSLLDSVGVTSSEFQQQTTYTRAVEGELAKTISAMKGVETATVKLAMPEESVFVDSKQDPTASVFIKSKAGATIAGEQVESIVHLVSAGIPGMAATDVAVIDANGEVLSSVGVGVGNGQGKKSTEYEVKTAEAIQVMLDKVVGRGNAVVSVSADLNYDQTQRTSEEYTSNPDTAPLSSATTIEEYDGAAGTTVGGVLGPDNIAVPNQNGDNAGGYKNTSETVNNSVNRVTEQTTTATGTVRRQTIAVAVNQVAAAALNEADLTEMVQNASGFNEERGDSVSVTQAAFDTSAADAAKEAFAEQDARDKAAQQQELYKQLGIAGGIVVILIIGAFILRRRAKSRREEIDPDALRLDAPEPFEFPQDDEDDEPIIPRPLRGLEAKRVDIETLADEEPAEMADLLRSWVSQKGDKA